MSVTSVVSSASVVRSGACAAVTGRSGSAEGAPPANGGFPLVSTWRAPPCYPHPMPDLDAFRAELRAWLATHIPPDLHREEAALLPEADRVRRLRAWQKTLAAARWVGINWPEEYGGRNAGIPEQIAYVEEMARARAPEGIGNLGLGIAGPPIIAYGTDEQKRRFLPRILSCDDLWCFGFSEPGAGSDLASLRTNAVLEGH